MLLTPEKSIELQVSAGADPMGLLLVRLAEAEAADGLTRSDSHRVIDFSCLKISLPRLTVSIGCRIRPRNGETSVLEPTISDARIHD